MAFTEPTTFNKVDKILSITNKRVESLTISDWTPIPTIPPIFGVSTNNDLVCNVISLSLREIALLSGLHILLLISIVAKLSKRGLLANEFLMDTSICVLVSSVGGDNQNTSKSKSSSSILKIENKVCASIISLISLSK